MSNRGLEYLSAVESCGKVVLTAQFKHGGSCESIPHDATPEQVSQGLKNLAKRIDSFNTPWSYLLSDVDIRCSPNLGAYGNFNFERKAGRWYVYTSMGDRIECVKPSIDPNKYWVSLL